MIGYDTSDTICAISTAEGVAAIGVVRITGVDSLAIVESVFRGKKLSNQAANTIHFGKIVDGDTVLDEVVVSIFRNPNSYTGEDTLEISCHGSPLIQAQILSLLVKKGARLAKEGEFTFRAFINGKLDLSQAEAVADLIAADSKSAKELALNQLRGGYSGRLKDLRAKLLDFASLLELELDFAEEDVEFANRDDLQIVIAELSKQINQLIESFEYGNAIKKGIPVAIIGEPNVGKSTLLNKILQEEKAIVSEIPGTTRDSIEDNFTMGGIQFRFIDTAGIRETSDKVEGIGIERTRQKAGTAKIILHLMEAHSLNGLDSSWNETEGQIYIKVVNKVDGLEAPLIEKLKSEMDGTFFISAKSGEGVSDLLKYILDSTNLKKSDGSGVVVSSERHLEALRNCLERLQDVVVGLKENRSSELVAMDVRQALHYLGEITGEVTTDDLLGNIFSRFCIGK